MNKNTRWILREKKRDQSNKKRVSNQSEFDTIQVKKIMSRFSIQEQQTRRDADIKLHEQERSKDNVVTK